jgi:hypothetical protein
MPETGDIAIAHIDGRERVYLVLDGHVTPDPTYGQYDEGYMAHELDNEDTEYFVSVYDNGVWRANHDDSRSEHCGNVTEWQGAQP